MPRVLEARIEGRACERVRSELGVLSLKLNLRGNNGWPDRLFLLPGGRPLLIEFKRPGEAPEPLQAHHHDHLRRLGYDIEVHDTIEGAVSAVRRRLAAARLPKKGHQVPA